MLKIYHAPHTRGIRPIWLCEELQIKYEVETIDFSATYRATPEWRALSPTGKVPVLVHNDVTIFESGAMVDYILDRLAPDALRPPIDHPDYGYYRQWCWFAESTLARPLGEIVNHRREFPAEAEISAVVDEMSQRAQVCLQTVAASIKQEYLLASGFSAADIMMGYSLYLAQMLMPEAIPSALQPYWQQLQQRAGFKTACAYQ